jgi:hypothetical protein
LPQSMYIAISHLEQSALAEGEHFGGFRPPRARQTTKNDRLSYWLV